MAPGWRGDVGVAERPGRTGASDTVGQPGGRGARPLPPGRGRGLRPCRGRDGTGGDGDRRRRRVALASSLAQLTTRPARRITGLVVLPGARRPTSVQQAGGPLLRSSFAHPMSPESAIPSCGSMSCDAAPSDVVDAVPTGTTSAGSTTVPGRLPVVRSASNASCRMTTAAAWSTTSRWSRDDRPAARSARWAAVVDNRSSNNRTGTGATARARDPAYARAARAEAPSAPERCRGRPTYTQPAPRSWTSTTTWSSDVALGSVATGVARIPSGSLAASPTRTEPTSTPNRGARPTGTAVSVLVRVPRPVRWRSGRRAAAPCRCHRPGRRRRGRRRRRRAPPRRP